MALLAGKQVPEEPDGACAERVTENEHDSVSRESECMWEAHDVVVVLVQALG